jgi:hypothetical protein
MEISDKKIYADGLLDGTFRSKRGTFSYKVEYVELGEAHRIVKDRHAFETDICDFDLQLFSEGHNKRYMKNWALTTNN